MQLRSQIAMHNATQQEMQSKIDQYHQDTKNLRPTYCNCSAPEPTATHSVVKTNYVVDLLAERLRLNNEINAKNLLLLEQKQREEQHQAQQRRQSITIGYLRDQLHDAQQIIKDAPSSMWGRDQQRAGR